jgi:thiol-disulfide isomerase/thioredoxin
LNQAASRLALLDLQGNPVSLVDDTPGKVILVNNWATWCPPCRTEMPELQVYFQAHTGKGFIVIAIESVESADIVKNFIQPLGLTFPVWLDPKGTALDSFQNWNLPSSYVVDQKRIVFIT